jgi:nucleotide-binding universal stress UspA family protein
MHEASGFSAIPSKILVPIDFSPSAHAALEAAAEIAKQFDAELHLVHVIPMFTSSTLPDFAPETKVVEGARKEAERHFTACQKDLAGKGIKVTYTVEIGNDVAGEVVDVLEREHADMLVISTHGVTGWHPLVFGSIAEKVVRLVHVPILLLPTPKPKSSMKVPSERLMEWW